MMDRLSNPAKIKAFELSEQLKDIMRDLFDKHQEDIMSGAFSSQMMADWDNNDKDLLTWREATNESAFERSVPASVEISEQEYFAKGILMVAMIRVGVELAFEAMTAAGIKAESTYYESLHETPLIESGRKRWVTGYVGQRTDGAETRRPLSPHKSDPRRPQVPWQGNGSKEKGAAPNHPRSLMEACHAQDRRICHRMRRYKRVGPSI